MDIKTIDRIQRQLNKRISKRYKNKWGHIVLSIKKSDCYDAYVAENKLANARRIKGVGVGVKGMVTVKPRERK